MLSLSSGSHLALEALCALHLGYLVGLLQLVAR